MVQLSFGRKSNLGLLALLGLAVSTNGQDPARPYPQLDSYLTQTNFLNHSSYIQDLDDHQWYLDNIPFVDFPDQSMQDVYYYRTSVIKRHLRWAHEGHGWAVTEFIHPVAWAGKFQSIPDSAPYHVLETRWLRDVRVSKNLIELYTRGGLEKLSGITYTHFMHQAILEHAEATGDIDFLTSQLEGLITTYDLWNVTRDATTGLYHRIPLSDAQEYSLPGYLTGGPGGGPMQVWDDFGLTTQEGGGNDYLVIWLGPETYRPNFNAYMIAGARAISTVANRTGQSDLAQTWSDYADTVYESMENLLWSDELQFWIDVVEGTNYRCQGRELIGYFPYRFDVGTNETYIRGLEAGLTTESFLTEFGPVTLEQSNPYYSAFKNTTYCCLWNGQSWPFSTSTYLSTLARIARDNSSSLITPSFFQEALSTYVATNYKDGVPYTAESHYPTIDMWSGDTTNHSENYFHSTYLDNIFTNLIGIVPTLDDKLVLQPLIPSNWTHFAVENLPYHGSLISIVWDASGSYYNLGNNTTAGLSVFSNGTLIHSQSSLAAVNISLPFSSQKAATALASVPEHQNILANVNSPWGLPSVTADYTFTSNGDVSPYGAYKMNDGLLWYDTTPDNRWTQNQSWIPYNTITVTLPRARALTSISLAVFADTDRSGVIDCPAGIRITTLNGSVLAERRPWDSCVPNALNTINFDSPAYYGDAGNLTTPATGAEIVTDTLLITMSDKQGLSVALSEIQLWVPPQTGPRWEAEDGLIGTFVGFVDYGLNGTIVNNGVELYGAGWVELGGVTTSSGLAETVNLVIIGTGPAEVTVRVNWLEEYTVTLSGTTEQNQTIAGVPMLRGNNIVTIARVSGTPWIDAIVVA